MPVDATGIVALSVKGVTWLIEIPTEQRKLLADIVELRDYADKVGDLLYSPKTSQLPRDERDTLEDQLLVIIKHKKTGLLCLEKKYRASRVRCRMRAPWMFWDRRRLDKIKDKLRTIEKCLKSNPDALGINSERDSHHQERYNTYLYKREEPLLIEKYAALIRRKIRLGDNEMVTEKPATQPSPLESIKNPPENNKALEGAFEAVVLFFLQCLRTNICAIPIAAFLLRLRIRLQL